MVKIRTRRIRGSDGRFGSAPALEPSEETDGADAADAGDIGAHSGAATGTASEATAEGQSRLGQEALDLTVDDLTAVDDDEPQPAAPRRRGRPPGRSNRAKRARSRTVADVVFGTEPPAQKLDRKLAGVLLTVIEGMAVPQIGPHARFEPDERKLIEPALGNILERMTPSSAKMFSSFADPIMLATGLLIWATRVFSRPIAPPAPRPSPTPIRPVPDTAPAPPAAPAGQPMDGRPPADLSESWGSTV